MRGANTLHARHEAVRGSSPDAAAGAQDDTCGVWQHCDCLGIPAGALPEAWLCEQCRLARADPFWRRLGPPPMPAQALAPTHPHRAFGDGLKYTEDVTQVCLPPQFQCIPVSNTFLWRAYKAVSRW